MTPEPAPVRRLPRPLADARPGRPGKLDRIDDSLHFGWAWHRHRYCYRRGRAAPRSSTPAAAPACRRWRGAAEPGGDGRRGRRLGRGRWSRPRAGRRPRIAGGRVPRARPGRAPAGDWGRFDFIVCRGSRPGGRPGPACSRTSPRALDPGACSSSTFPSHAGRQVARALRRAVEALRPPGAGSTSGPRSAWTCSRRSGPTTRSAPTTPGRRRGDAAEVERSSRATSTTGHDWTLDEAVALLERRGPAVPLRRHPRPWQPDRVFAPDASRRPPRPGRPARPRPPAGSSTPSTRVLHDEYRIYACPAGFDPRPGLARRPGRRPARVRPPGPPPTGLADPVGLPPRPAPRGGSPTGRSRAPGRARPRSDLLLGAVDGVDRAARSSGSSPPGPAPATTRRPARTAGSTWPTAASSCSNRPRRPDRPDRTPRPARVRGSIRCAPAICTIPRSAAGSAVRVTSSNLATGRSRRECSRTTAVEAGVAATQSAG